MMKKSYFVMAAACLAIGLGVTACGKSSKPETAETETTVAGSTAGERAEEETGGENTEEEKTEESSAEKEQEETEKTVTGRIEKIQGTVLSISGQNDIAYEIDIADAEAGGSLEAGEGDQIQITFIQDGEDVGTALFYDILTSAALEGEMDPILSGTVEDAAMNTIAIKAESGKTYRFSTAAAQMVTGEQGIVIGENVDVTYLGSLPGESEEGLALRVITEEASGSAEATFRTLTGSLQSLDEETLVLETDDGSIFSFAAEGMADPEEYETGDRIAVTYHGSLTGENAVLEEIEEAE